jgi:Protein of unknown function (DUF3181)
MASSEQLENLAAEIGDNVYIDVAKWHLYLKDAKLHTLVAEKALEAIANQSNKNVTGDLVNTILAQVPIALGGGRKELPLSDLLPVAGQAKLLDILQEFARDL